MYLSIIYHARPRVAEVIIDNVIEFPDSHYPGLRCGD